MTDKLLPLDTNPQGIVPSTSAPVTIEAWTPPMQDADAVVRCDQSPAVEYLTGLSPGSTETMGKSLDRLCVIIASEGVIANEAEAKKVLGEKPGLRFQWWRLRRPQTRWIHAQITSKERGLAPNTAKLWLSALRGVLKECSLMKGYTQDGRERPLMSADDFHTATAWRAVVGERESPGLFLDEKMRAKLFVACDQRRSPLRERDAAILAIGLGCGLRRAEIAGLQMSNLTNNKLTFVGKRNKQRTVPLLAWALIRVQTWLRVRGDAPGSMFFNVKAIPGKLLMTPRPLSADSVSTVVYELGEAAGVDLSAHDLRRTFITGCFMQNMDPHHIQLLAGHDDIKTTMRYDMRPRAAMEKSLADAIDKLE
ncbi:MAG: site-specific integrase [Sphingomonas sp.]|uniref:tyrosine-type recombinase/integrase n=1 Tax=Sphingomonas sp. TaxID=28214 RepID=UPI0035697B91